VARFYKITPKGKVTTLYSFCAQQNCADGSAPLAPLIQAFDRNFYGTTSANALNGGGTVFKITPTGQLTTLYSFCQQLPGCTDGASPSAGLVQGIDGSLYGTTVGGGAHGWGTVFKVTLRGILTTLHSFAGPPTDGGNPCGGLARGSDGTFYGTAYQGGIGSCSSGCGTVFKITRDGAFTTLHTFNGPDGMLPVAGLVQATDGNFYGMTTGGGSYSAGTIFTISPNGALDTLHSFCSQSNCDDGSAPFGALFQATNGTLYGTTSYGGKDNDGTVFSLSVGLSPFVAFVHDSGKIGSKVEILGQGFTGTSAVSFNGMAANFVVHSDTYLTATVPSSATTGFVTVAAPGGTLQSNKQFRVGK
jgi:uncharacterized repeat protein (TIGR03803 family)